MERSSLIWKKSDPDKPLSYTERAIYDKNQKTFMKLKHI